MFMKCGAQHDVMIMQQASQHHLLKYAASYPIDAFEKSNNQREKHQEHVGISNLTPI